MPKSARMTIELAELIKHYLRTRPDLYQHQIAALLRVNQGRVCEVKRGDWGPWKVEKNESDIQTST